MPLLVLSIFLAAMSIMAFAAFGIDKRRAVEGDWRIPEAALLWLAALGGGLGAFVGMRRFHHKTRKRRFRILVPVLMSLQLVGWASLAALTLYASDYYHAQGRAIASLAGDEVVSVSVIDGTYQFDGPGDDTALVFYPGAKVETTAYAPLMSAIARGGVDCFLVDMPYHLAFFGISKADLVIASHTDGYSHWYVGGHSLGGVAAGLYARDRLDSLDGIVFLASYPVGDLKRDGFRALSVVGTEDGVLNHAAYTDSLVHMPDDFTELVLEGGNHAQFGDYGIQAKDGDAQISALDQQDRTARAILDFALGA